MDRSNDIRIDYTQDGSPSRTMICSTSAAESAGVKVASPIIPFVSPKPRMPMPMRLNWRKFLSANCPDRGVSRCEFQWTMNLTFKYLLRRITSMKKDNRWSIGFDIVGTV